jgi:hypothetical protein
MSVPQKLRSSCPAAANQDRRRTLLAEKKKKEGKHKKEERKEDDLGVEEPKNNQAAQAIEQAGKKVGGSINQGQAGQLNRAEKKTYSKNLLSC